MTATADLGDRVRVYDVIDVITAFDTTTLEPTYTLTNPASEDATLREPDGTETVLTVTDPGVTGLRYTEFVPDQTGEHIVRMGTAAGTGQGYAEISVYVRRSPVA